jgi:hypothetical protein
MIAIKMKFSDNDHYEFLAEMLPIAVTILGIIIMSILYNIYF